MIYTCLVTPFKIAFIQEETTASLVVELVVSGLFFVDIAVLCFTAYYDNKRVLVIAPAKIFRNYASSWMVVDLLGALPYVLFLQNSWGSLLRLLRISRLFKLAKLRAIFGRANHSHLLHSIEPNPLLISLAGYQLWTLLTVHLVACAWYGQSVFLALDTNWVDAAGLSDESIYDLYVASLYWTVMTWTTVGYGDIKPANAAERFLTILTMILGVTFYTHAIGLLAKALNEQSSPDKQIIHEAQKALFRIKNRTQITPEFFNKLQAALMREKQFNDQAKKNVFAELPQRMARQLTIQMNKELLGENFFFTDKPLGFVTRVLAFAKPFSVKPGEHVFKKGDFCDALYFVVEGEVELYEKYQQYEIPFTTLSVGDYFGDIEIFLRVKTV